MASHALRTAEIGSGRLDPQVLGDLAAAHHQIRQEHLPLVVLQRAAICLLAGFISSDRCTAGRANRGPSSPAGNVGTKLYMTMYR